MAFCATNLDFLLLLTAIAPAMTPATGAKSTDLTSALSSLIKFGTSIFKCGRPIFWVLPLNSFSFMPYFCAIAEFMSLKSTLEI